MNLSPETLASRLTEFQRLGVLALADGELSGAQAAQRSGYKEPRLAKAAKPQSAAMRHSLALWWGRVVSGIPPGLIAVRWSAALGQHYHSLTPIGSEVARILQSYEAEGRDQAGS